MLLPIEVAALRALYEDIPVATSHADVILELANAPERA